MSTLEIRDHVFIITPEGVQILPNANYSIKYVIENFHMTPQKSTAKQFLHLLHKKTVPSLYPVTLVVWVLPASHSKLCESHR